MSPMDLTLKASKKLWSKGALYHGMKVGGGENNLVPVLALLNCIKQNSAGLFEATGQIAKLKTVSPCNCLIQNFKPVVKCLAKATCWHQNWVKFLVLSVAEQY